MSREEREEVIKNYEELRKKYSLPKLDDVESELGIKIIYNPVINQLLTVLHERIGNSAGHLEINFQPTRMADAIESKFFSDKEKQEMFKFYKELIAVIHEIALSIYQNEESRAKCFKATYDFYLKKLKPFMQDFLKRQADGWRKEESQPKSEKSGSYFG